MTNIQDEQMALATLASLNWDLPRAIEAQLYNDSDDIGPMEVDDSLLIEHDEGIHRRALREFENRLGYLLILVLWDLSHKRLQLNASHSSLIALS